MQSEKSPLWQPSQKLKQEANITPFMQRVAQEWNLPAQSYFEFYQWSIDHPEKFWSSLWKFSEVKGTPGKKVLIHPTQMPGAQFFPDGTLNFAENLLRRRDHSDALIFWGEDKVKQRISHHELYNQVSQLTQALRGVGVREGDRVAGYLPNMPEAVIAMLATASLGAIWSSCSPDFGAQGIVDRFGQIEPKILFAVDGYWYHGKQVEVLDRIEGCLKQIPSIETVLIIPYLSPTPALKSIPRAQLLQDFVSNYTPREIPFVQMPFNHPLFILYSSGTTGVPKCIVHGAGGTLLKHLSELQLHSDIRSGDRLFYFSTCGWMMWNWFVSALSLGATLLLYDGSPFTKGGNILFDYADAEGMTQFGTSAKFIDECHKRGLAPMNTHKLSTIRSIFSTGSPLVPESFDYVYTNIKKDVCLSSISGGTDIIGCFVLGNPLLPVWRGEIQCPALGVAVEVFDEEGHSIQEEKGELVCTKPFPSMPIGFWNDTDGSKYRSAYFERFPNVWCHGDYSEITEHGGVIIYGRSDAVLKPAGVRIGTAEIYRQVEQLEEVVESLAIAQEWENDVRIVLFVVLRNSLQLDEGLIKKIKQQIGKNTTVHHVPAKIVQVTEIPRTKSGKIVELAVRNIVHGRPVRNIHALANPQSLDQYKNRLELSL